VGRAADPFLMNCDVNLGSPRRSRPPVEYVEASIAVRYTGCERVRLPGRPSTWSLTVVGPTFGGEARTQLMAAPEADQPTGVVCGSDPAGREPVCAWALRALRCEVLGDGVMVRCAAAARKAGGVLSGAVAGDQRGQAMPVGLNPRGWQNSGWRSSTCGSRPGSPGRVHRTTGR
jgi:hypothetical protein